MKRPGLIVAFAVIGIVIINCGLAFSAATTSGVYPTHTNIGTTYFWVGEGATSDNGYISNSPSAWDDSWQQHFGGVDDPNNRNGYYPAAFTPNENPFYFALPYNDFDSNGRRKTNANKVYWWGAKQWGPDESCCKDQWIRITKGTKTAFAQWEDCGPYGEDDINYVFGTSAPASPANDNAGLDVSPAVRDYLGLSDIDEVNWQFVGASSVDAGPWKNIITGNPVDGAGDVIEPGDTITSYFAEGHTGDGFEEWLSLMNPGATATTAHATFMFSDGTTKTQNVPVGATSRATVNVNDIVGPGKDVSIKINSDTLVVAERPMYFYYKGKWTGGHDVMGAASPAKTFYFAEGYTGDGFEEWLCLMNPEAAPTTAHVTFMFADGTTKGQDVTIGGTTRATLNVNAAAGSGKNVSIQIASDAPIVAERPMYFSYKNTWTGGHDVMGAASPAKTFYFAEGYTGKNSFDEWLCLANPNPAATTAHVTFMFTDGTTKPLDVSIGGTSRSTLNVNEAVGSDKNVSIAINSDAAIVAERPMYFSYKSKWTGGHDVMGCSQ